ncbi:MAG: TonB-dependent receptor, partial [Rhodothermales bacterium]
AQGVVHFITKNPFDYPGTTLFAETGERQIVRGGFRHAGVIGTRLGYKMVGGYFSGEDWHYNPINSQDAEILGAMADSLIDLDGSVVGELGGRTYDIYAAFVKADASYKVDDQTTIVANLGYSRVKNSFNGSGEWQWDPVKEVYGQLRMTSGRLFAQTFFSAVLPGKAFNYRTGLFGHNTSSEFGVQVQHGLEILNGRGDLTGGLDFQRSIPRTRGSLMGRNEDHDDFYTTGAYLQSQTHVSPLIDLTVSGRLDYFSPTEELLLSPRGALVFKLAPEHSLRLTYNRASGSVRGLAYFMDFITADQGPFVVRLRGNADGFTFPDPLATTSFVTIPGFPARDDGVGISLQRAYAAVTSGLVAPGAPLGDSEGLAELLWSRMQRVDGSSQGVLKLDQEEVQGVRNQEPVKPLIANTFEVGYKGLLSGRIALGVDAYYTRRERFLYFQLITPFVVVSGLGQDLSDAVSTLFTEDDLAAYGLNLERLAALYEDAGSQLGANELGIVEPVENFDPSTRPELLLINANFGRLDYLGIDVSAEAILSDCVTTFANTSWVSDNFFDTSELGETGTGYVVSMNAPRTRVRLGLEYADPIGFDLRGSMCYVQSFEVRDDLPLYSGKVDGYTVVDFAAGYEFGSAAAGLRLDVSAQNFFNNRHREYIGVPTVGRLVTARLTYSL